MANSSYYCTIFVIKGELFYSESYKSPGLKPLVQAILQDVMIKDHWPPTLSARGAARISERMRRECFRFVPVDFLDFAQCHCLLKIDLALENRNSDARQILEGGILIGRGARWVCVIASRHEYHHALPRTRKQYTVRIAQVVSALDLFH